MSFADESEFAAFIGRDQMLHALTADAVAEALRDFSGQLQSGLTIDWLAMAVRRSLAIPMRNVSDGPERTSNSDIRAMIEKLSTGVQATWRELFEADSAVDDRIWTIAWRRWDGEGGNVGEPAEYRRFRAALAELDWLARFLRIVAAETESPRGSWRAKERKWIRIERGHFLAPVFETAFGQPVTANNWPGDAVHKAPTAFMDFYQRMVALAFDEKATPDLSGVLKLACKLHREQPVQFAAGVIPKL